MSVTRNQEKLEQFEEFFTIEHKFSANAERVDIESLGDYQSFLDNMPAPFKMASDMMILDQAALRPLQALNGVAGQLVEYLNHQTQKIDLLMSYILNQQDEQSTRVEGTSFGGGGIQFSCNEQHQLNQYLELKIFIQSGNCAIYCIGEVIEIYHSEGSCHYKAIFHYIRDEDRELLVRASLHKQSEQLQLLAKKRKQQINK